ncbi:MAG: SprT family zinc-dependent metalloprotease [Gammaproteobacteria bacterium]
MWPPAYTVKKHKRAKYVKFRASLQHGLQITVPYRFNLNMLPGILDEHKDWIVGQLAKLPQPLSELPSEIVLSAINETWKVFYLKTSTVPRIIKRPGNEIVLMGDTDNKPLCQRYLVAWVKRYAKQILPLQLEQISQLAGLPYQGVRVKDQKTLWGSCTANKMINLNYKLLFLPMKLMQHVLIHELCHTMHMNHSSRFWALVQRFDACSDENKKLLKKGDTYMPGWLV